MKFQRVSLFVSDLEASKEFYLDVVDLPLEQVTDDGASFSADGASLVLIGPDRWNGDGNTDVDVGNAELAFSIPDIDECMDHLQEKGVNYTGPFEVPCGHEVVSITDPDGVQVQLFEPADQEVPSTTRSEPQRSRDVDPVG